MRGGTGMKRRGRDKARVINFIFVFLLPQLRENTIIRSRKVGPHLRARPTPGAPWGGRRKYKDSNELLREFLKHKRAERGTEGWCFANLGSTVWEDTLCGPSIDGPSTITVRLTTHSPHFSLNGARWSPADHSLSSIQSDVIPLPYSKLDDAII